MKDKSKMKPLHTYTDKELMNVLENNEKISLIELAGFCSEILRRILDLNPGLLLDETAEYTEF